MTAASAVDAPRHHGARVLLVAGHVGDDESAPVGGKEAVCDIELLRVGLGRRERILVEHLRLVDEPPDKRALAIVHAAAGHEAQHALVLVHREVFQDVQVDRVGNVRHQK
jgi:hypothetical protein